MPNARFDDRCDELLASLEETRQKKKFLYLTGPMGPTAFVKGEGEVIVLCSNNYLGLASHPEVVRAGIEGLERYGAGTASVRFICGSFACHRQLEETIAWLVGTEAALSYVSGWNANEALFPTLAGLVLYAAEDPIDVRAFGRDRQITATYGPAAMAQRIWHAIRAYF